MAAVDCASLSRRAMVWRSLVMRTRSSREASSGADVGRGAFGASAILGVSAGCDGAPLAMASSTSPFSTWPRLPDPATWSTATLASASSFAAAGAGGILRSVIGVSPATAAALASASLTVACAGIARRLRDRIRLRAWLLALAFAAGLAASPPAPIWPSSAPTPTVSPSLAVISDSVPAAGAGTSIVTLSVSSSTRGSSAAMASPTFLNHLPMVASVTDSPSVGTRISVAIFRTCPLLSYKTIRRARRRGGRRAAPDASTSCRSPARPPPDVRCSARADAWRRYGRAPIPDTDR